MNSDLPQTPCPPEKISSNNLDEQLKQLEQGLHVEQGKLKAAEIEIKEREEQIKALDALIGEINVVVDDYSRKHEELKRKDEDYYNFCKDEKKCLANVLGTNTQRVCEIAKSVMDEIVAIGVDIEKHEIGCKDAKGELEKAKRSRADSEKELKKAAKQFEAWKDPVKSIEARFKDLEKIKKEICTEHEAKNYAIAYYLLMFGKSTPDQEKKECPPPANDCAPVKKDESCVSAEEDFFRSFEKYCVRFDNPENYPPEIVDPKVLKDRIIDAWNNYREADAQYNCRDAEVKKLEKKLELMKSQLAEKKKNFEKTIRRRLSEIKQQQPSAMQE